MACCGSNELVTPRPRAVAGMSCISPCAPALLTAFGLYPDSTLATAASSFGDTSYLAPALRNMSAYGTPASDVEFCRLAGRTAAAAVAERAVRSVLMMRRMCVGVSYTDWILTWSPGFGAAIILLSPR